MHNEKEMEAVCKNVRYLRVKNGLSKKEMSKKFGIGIKSLNSIEKGVLPKRISVDVIFEVYKNLGIRPKDIFYPIE